MATAATVASCRQATTVVQFQAVRNLNLDVQYAVSGDVASTCPNFLSWLVRVETNAGAGWSTTLLYDYSASKLYGCGNAATPCPGTQLDFDIGQPARVMLEALDKDPSAYAAGSLNVVCRGIADPMADSSSLLQGTDGRITARLTLFPVGGSTPLDTAGTMFRGVQWGAATSMTAVSPMVMGTRESGAVLVAGGVIPGASPRLPPTIWRFSPRTLSFTSAGSLAEPRAGLTATLFLSTGDAAVLFAGGSSQQNTANYSPSNNYEVLTPSGFKVGPLTMPHSRAFHAAVWLPPTGLTGPTGTMGAIAVLGGTGYNVGSQKWPSTSEVPPVTIQNIDYFVPAGNNLCPGGPIFCANTPPGLPAVLTTARGFSASAVSYSGANAPTVWLFGGLGLSLGVDTLRSDLDVIHFGTAVNQTQQVPGLPTPVAGGSSVALSAAASGVMGGLPVFAGGMSDLIGQTQASAHTAYVNAAGVVTTLSDLAPPNSGAAGARFGAPAVSLLDHSLVFFGGLTASGPTAEILHFVVDTAGGGVFQSSPQMQMKQARTGATATALTGTRSWLDRAVLVTGGGGPEGAELWVPAWNCNGTQPSPAVDGIWGVTLPPLCDRNRGAEYVTDPLTGQSIPP